MGDWGTGNFDNDTAADHLSILTNRLITEVADAMADDPADIEPDEYWGVVVPANPRIVLTETPEGSAKASCVSLARNRNCNRNCNRRTAPAR
ncbi:DUF4259 domain-containing protein [Streptomyces cacaoi]|uniref:DUF4259 domain-containing protein n=1 Tax=Streptomyces cacaoi TaxID=1898 RepID=UPI00374846CF